MTGTYLEKTEAPGAVTPAPEREQSPAVAPGGERRGQAGELEPLRNRGFAAAAPRTMRRAASHFRSILFVLMVVLPTILAAVYYLVFASDQYVSEMRFGIHSAEGASRGGGGGGEGMGGMGMASASMAWFDSNVLTQYIQSREMVELLDEKVRLKQIYSRPQVDFLSRLNPDSSIEDVVKYYQRKVLPFFDLTTGSVTVEVRAFTREDAKEMGDAILAASENALNALSRRAREDMVKLQRVKVDEAKQRLKQSQQAMRAFRDKHGLLDADKEGAARLSSVTKLRDQLSQTRAELMRMRAYLDENAPSVVATMNQIRAQDEQLRLAEAQMTTGDRVEKTKALSTDMGEYESLEADIKFAQKYLDGASDALLRSETEAARQTTYLQVFVRPALADRALYPQRVQSIILFALYGLGAWMLCTLLYASIREHR